MAPVPGHANRFVFALPQPDDTFYIGLTDEEVDGPLPDVPEVPEDDVTFLLGVLNGALETSLTRADVVGSYAGLRPLLDGHGASADLSRRHAVIVSADGMVTIVGGKLTTYRRMAEDAVDRAVGEAHLDAGPCRTRDLPLLGSRPGAGNTGSARLDRRFGSEAALVLEVAREATGLSPDELLAPAGPTVPVTLAELVFGVTHEGAVDVGDLLDRRTRVGLVPADRAIAAPLAERALLLANRLQQG
jgi:glycerol-3-phosphate dehydrogenase